MIVLAVIPARGGSKSIPQKNLVPLLGEPLIGWTCRAALGARLLTRTILSTDDPNIAAVARNYGIEVPFMRPAELAEDATPSLPVIQHAVAWVEASAFRPDAVVILQPTSPLRRAEHIDAAIDLLAATGADSVVTVVEVPHQFNPVSVMRIEEGRLVPFLGTQGMTVLRRQDKPRVYARNGAAVYAIRRDILMGGSLFGQDCRPLEMSPADSVDIDGPTDLVIAEALLRTRESH